MLRASRIGWVVLLSLGCSAPAAYPTGPYGVQQGETLRNLRLETLEAAPFHMKDIHTGAANAAVLYVTGTWCFSCTPEITWLNQYLTDTNGAVAAYTVLLQNARFEKATAADGQEFEDGFGPTFPTLLDPASEIDELQGADIIPFNVVLDTRTMQIEYRDYGFDAQALETALEQILGSGT